MSQRRISERIPVGGRVRLFWEDETGRQHFSQAEARDISDTGLSITLRERVPKHTTIQVECLTNRVQGSATVRRCDQRGMDFIVGLEFIGGMRMQTKMRYT